MTDEILTMEQLDAVAGGTNNENNADAKFFRAIGFNIPDCLEENSDMNELRRAWAKSGIMVIEKYGDEETNEYYYGGKKIPRAQAINIAMKKSGKQIDLRPYYL